MTHITCRLTAKNRDQLRNSTLGSRVWATICVCVRVAGVWSSSPGRGLHVPDAARVLRRHARPGRFAPHAPQEAGDRARRRRAPVVVRGGLDGGLAAQSVVAAGRLAEARPRRLHDRQRAPAVDATPRQPHPQLRPKPGCRTINPRAARSTKYRTIYHKIKGKRSLYSTAERMVPELIPVLGSQPAGDVSHKPDGRLPLLSARPAVTLATLKRAATNFAAW